MSLKNSSLYSKVYITESYNNIRLGHVSLNKKSIVEEIRLYPYMIGLEIEKYISVTVSHARNKLYF